MKKAVLFLSLVMVGFVQSGCSSDSSDEAEAFDGSVESIENFVTPELLQTMEDMGLVVHPGNTPPSVEGVFLLNANILQSTNIDSDTPGSTFADAYMTFENQDDANLKVDFSYDQPTAGESGVGNGTLLSGTANNFTAYLKQTVTHVDGDADTIMVISGTMTDTGIVDFQWALFMKENNGHASFIENGKGRIFIDSDDLVVRQ